MKSVTINLSNTLHFPEEAGIRANDDSFSVALKTTDISAPTTFSLEFSHDRKEWYQAVNPLDYTDFEFTLSDKFFRSFEVDNGIYWRLTFASGSTGTINGTINDE